MNCLNDQQLAEIVLGIDDAESADAHLATCGICRAKLAELRRIPEHFARADANRDRDHADSRAKLLAEIERMDNSRPATSSNWLRQALGRFSRRQRITIGGLGLSAAVVLLITIFVANTARPLSAMERMVKQLRAVTSFSFELEETSDRISGDNRRRIQRNDINFWRTPASWHGTTKMVKLPLPPPGAAGELLVDVEEIYPPGERGILIDHKRKTFFRTRVMESDDFPDYSPVNWVQRMSKGNVKVVSDLGTKQLHGKTAHGYVVSLGNPDPTSGQNAIEVWLDPATDLPIEFRYEDKGKTETIDAWTNVTRVYNCRWNIALNDTVFEMNEPASYENGSFPTETKEIEQIVEALRLYAQLSGGHYPQMTKFDGDLIHNEMLRLAGDAPPPQADFNRDAFLQKVQQAKPGLDWTTRILRNEHHSGYYGTEVGPNDLQKLLMWWPDHIGDYRVIYGDLRTEALPYAEWSKLVPPEVAESHAPVEYTKSGG
jgi:hypothetical protein